MKRTTKHVALDVHQANQECVGPGGERTGDRTDPQQIGSLVITVRRPVTRNAHRCPRTILHAPKSIPSRPGPYPWVAIEDERVSRTSRLAIRVASWRV